MAVKERMSGNEAVAYSNETDQSGCYAGISDHTIHRTSAVRIFLYCKWRDGY